MLLIGKDMKIVRKQIGESKHREKGYSVVKSFTGAPRRSERALSAGIMRLTSK